MAEVKGTPSMSEYKCAFCNGAIADEPYTELICGKIFTFHAKACANALKALKAVATIDTRGKTRPEPNIMVRDKLAEIKPGEILEVVGDVLNKPSVERFISMRGPQMVSSTVEGDIFKILVRRLDKERPDIPLSQCSLLKPQS
jgi:TusA-related sulfurtransferase